MKPLKLLGNFGMIFGIILLIFSQNDLFKKFFQEYDHSLNPNQAWHFSRLICAKVAYNKSSPCSMLRVN